MKKIYTVLALTIFVLPLFAQNIPSYVPKDGLVGYWPFNGNANDESGNGNHGIVNGATLTEDRNGIDNSSYDFDGKSNFIEVAHSNTLNFSSNGMSFNLWMRVPEFPSDEKEHYFLSKHSGIGTSMNGIHAALSNYMNSNSLFYRYKTENNKWGEWGGNGFLNNLLKTNNWFQVTIVVDSIYDYIYLNGELLSKKIKQPDVKYGENSGSLFFGKDININISSTDGVYLGRLDDITIYNRALSDQEVKQLYEGCSKETAISSSFNTLMYTTNSPINLTATPKSGTFSGNGVTNNTFNPAKAKLGKNTVKYNFKNTTGCLDSTNFVMILVDTLGNKCSTYDTLKIKVKLTTGIKSGQQTLMNIYPNPTSDKLIIETNDIQALGGYKYQIVDLQGKEVYNALATSVETEISLKFIGAKGIFILHIVDEKGVSIENKKIVLE